MDNKEIVDMLFREKFINEIIQEISLIEKNEKNSFIMIDGEWGCGKTTVLQMLINKIKNNYNVVTYNCWESSFYSDPLIGIISTTTEQLSQYKDINEFGIALMKHMANIKSIGMGTISNMTGVKLDADINTPENQYKSLESYIKDFKDQLINFNDKNVGKDNHKTFVIIVDELDRCLPEYAIKVLERLYLLFKGIPNLIVIIANNMVQLEHSIKSIFGNDFEIKRYLEKFINKIKKLETGEVNHNNVYQKYYNYFNKFDFDNQNEEVLSFISNILYKENARYIDNKCIEIAKVHDIVFPNENGMDLCLFELLASFIKVEDAIIAITNIGKEPFSKRQELWIKFDKTVTSVNNKVGDWNIHNIDNPIERAIIMYIMSFYNMIPNQKQFRFNTTIVNEELTIKIRKFRDLINYT